MKWRFGAFAVGSVLALAAFSACGDDGARTGTEPELDAEAMLDAALTDAAPIDGGACSVANESVVPVASAVHRNGELNYPDLPPAGGDHNPCWARWGTHEAELADERWVHNLEHGGVVFLYRCPDGCAADVEAMRAFVDGRMQALLTPYAALPTRFAVVSWGVRLTTDCFDMPRFQQFYREHVGRGLEQVASDPPNSCL